MDLFFILCAKYLVYVSVLVLAFYFFYKRTRSSQVRMTIFAIPAALVSYGFGLIGGHLYYDPRPFVIGHFTPLVAHAANNGFPSDHTLLASALAMIGLFWNRNLGIALWIIALLVAIARVYVGVHHALDVAGSMVFAILGVLAIYWLLHHVAGKEII